MNLIDGRLVKRDGRMVFVSDRGLEHRMSREFEEHLTAKATDGRRVIWGVRPENMRVAEAGDTTNVYQAKVIVTEILGPTSTVLVDAGGHEMQVSLPAPHRPTRNQIVPLAFKSKHLYLFDKETGLSLIEE